MVKAGRTAQEGHRSSGSHRLSSARACSPLTAPVSRSIRHQARSSARYAAAHAGSSGSVLSSLMQGLDAPARRTVLAGR